MLKILYIIFLSLIVANCTIKKVVKHHGVPFLEKKKEFYNKDDMKNLKVVKSTTESGFSRSTFVYNFMSSMRQKINDPLNKRAEKQKEISQR